MDFVFTPEQEALRAEVRAFIAEHKGPEVDAENRGADIMTERGPRTRELYAKIAERGWLAVSWPREWGGQGGSRIEQYLVEEEFARAGLNVAGGGTGAPAILAAGTPQQKERFLRDAIHGRVFFAQGFTEPQAGADLAGLRCQAVRDGQEYVINGQKTFTTGAHVATHIYLMARTDPGAERHAGISIFLVPMDTPGITVRPLWTIQNDPPAPRGTTYGESRTNEVFFQDVRVPPECRLGPENEGWFIGQRGLTLDRVGARRYLISVWRDEDVVNWVKGEPVALAGERAAGRAAHGGDAAVGAGDGEGGGREGGAPEVGVPDVGVPAAEREALRRDPVVRDKLAELWIEAQVCRLMTMRSMSIEERGGRFSYEAAAEKVWAPEHGVRTTEAISQILGPAAQLLNTSPGAVEDGLFAHNLLGAFQSGINHGSVQVMRDQVARHGLQMPRSR